MTRRHLASEPRRRTRLAALVAAARRWLGGAPAQTSSPRKREPAAEPAADLRLTVAVERAMRWDKLYRSPLTLEELAEHVGDSRHRVSEALNRHLGDGFYDYVNRYRVEEARALLLAEPGTAVADIASRVGFGAIHTFNRAFKRATGTTPSEFRRRAGRSPRPLVPTRERKVGAAGSSE